MASSPAAGTTVGAVGSAIVIVVPEAEHYVGELRHQLDPVAAKGVPAHVTLLYPFRRKLDERAAATVADIAARVTPFALRFTSARSFPDGVVYLAPSPEEPIRRLTGELAAAFPDCPPYGGTVGDPIPHLTVGHGLEPEAAERLTAQLSELPPFATTVDRLTMLHESTADRWTVAAEWPLGRAADVVPTFSRPG